VSGVEIRRGLFKKLGLRFVQVFGLFSRFRVLTLLVTSLVTDAMSAIFDRAKLVRYQTAPAKPKSAFLASLHTTLAMTQACPLSN